NQTKLRPGNIAHLFGVFPLETHAAKLQEFIERAVYGFLVPLQSRVRDNRPAAASRFSGLAGDPQVADNLQVIGRIRSTDTDVATAENDELLLYLFPILNADHKTVGRLRFAA